MPRARPVRRRPVVHDGLAYRQRLRNRHPDQHQDNNAAGPRVQPPQPQQQTLQPQQMQPQPQQPLKPQPERIQQPMQPQSVQAQFGQMTNANINGEDLLNLRPNFGSRPFTYTLLK